jgi:RNA 3'-terminal phosphate cyclase (ATP)
MAEAVQIDGSYGEGGGQIIRTSLSLAAITGRPLEIANIRARRSKPGLQRQHLTAVHAAAALCNARLTGAAVGSVHLVFEPQAGLLPGPFRFDIGTAGATSLVAQTLLVPLARGSVDARATITGGTHVPHSPPAEYVEAVYVPVLRRAGLEARFQYHDAGFFPKGGGHVEIDVSPGGDRAPLDLTERGKLVSLRAFIVTGALPPHVSERGAAAVERFMKGVGRPVTVERREKRSLSQGAAVVLAAECEGGYAGFSALGELGKPMERVAEEACEAFMAWWKTGAACDEHLADQLVLPMALTPGESRWTTSEVTEHLRTVLWVTQQFLPIRYSLDEREDGSGAVTLEGVKVRGRSEGRPA